MVAQNKSFGQYLRELVLWLHNAPLTRPLLALLYSRKALIASALTALILQEFPKLAPARGDVQVFSAEVVLIVFVWLVTSLGYALEDFAEKHSGGSERPLA